MAVVQLAPVVPHVECVNRPAYWPFWPADARCSMPDALANWLFRKAAHRLIFCLLRCVVVVVNLIFAFHGSLTYFAYKDFPLQSTKRNHKLISGNMPPPPPGSTQVAEWAAAAAASLLQVHVAATMP